MNNLWPIKLEWTEKEIDKYRETCNPVRMVWLLLWASGSSGNGTALQCRRTRLDPCLNWEESLRKSGAYSVILEWEPGGAAGHKITRVGQLTTKHTNTKYGNNMSSVER